MDPALPDVQRKRANLKSLVDDYVQKEMAQAKDELDNPSSELKTIFLAMYKTELLRETQSRLGAKLKDRPH